jgi:hypothetical protein
MYLLGFSDLYPSSRYGAIWFSHLPDNMTSNNSKYNETVITQCEYVYSIRPVNYTADCARFGGVGYVIQYNFTALHSALLYESLANEALVRHATSTPDFTVEMTIAPLPITAAENNLGSGQDGLFAWFLVSFFMKRRYVSIRCALY